MIVFNLMFVAWFVFIVILLSGVKIMYNLKYFQLVLTVFVMYTPISMLIEGYKLGEYGFNFTMIVSLILLVFTIWIYRRRTHLYSIHNVKESDVINIIERYLERQNIKYEIRSEEIYFPEIQKTVFVRHVMQTTLECRAIKDTDFYNELVDSVRVGIKEIKIRYLSMEGLFNLVFFLFFCWIRFTFLI